MSKASIVFQKWSAHLKNDITRSGQGSSNPRMKFSKGGAPVKKLSNFYIVGDTAGTGECYVVGHGGLMQDDYCFDNQAFKVPTGITMNFYQPDGYMLSCAVSQLRNGAPIKHGGTNDQLYTAGMDCPNYILTKAQGTRHAGSATVAETWEMDYSGAQSVAEDVGVVIVLVRNRWFHAGVTLKQCVSDVNGAVKSLTTFNCVFCRVHEGYTNDAWSAGTGTWTTG